MINECAITTDKAIEIIESLGLKISYIPMVEYPIDRNGYELITLFEAMRRINVSKQMRGSNG